MKFISSFLLLFLLILSSLQAQNSNIAKLKFEQAEEAFNKNDFFSTLIRLEEAEKLLGEVNPRILYLRIIAQANMIDHDRSVLPALKENCAFYLERYKELESVVEKYREVYMVSERLQDYEENSDQAAGYQAFLQKEYTKAMTLYLKAAEVGYAPAYSNIGWLYEHGLGVNKEYTTAIQWYQRGVDKENDWGYYNMGRMYYHGLGVEKNGQQALSLFLKAAAKNNSEGMVGVADTYSFHFNDHAKALPFYLKAAQRGHSGASFRAGWLYYLGKNGVTRDDKKALEWLSKAADKGHHDAMNYMGLIHKFGRSVPVNYITALDWFVKAAERGNTYAPGNIASMYEEGGPDFKKNRKLAAEWREKQAALKAKQ